MLRCLERSTIHLQTEANPSIALEGSMNAIRSVCGLRYRCLVMPDGQISAAHTQHQVLPHPPPTWLLLFLGACGCLLLISGGLFMIVVNSSYLVAG